MVVAENPEQQLRWEARQRPRAGAAAVLAALLTLAAELWTAAIFRDAPRIPFAASLAQALQPGPIGSRPSARRAFYAFYDAHGGALLAASVLRALGYIALAYALTFLVAAVRPRRPDLPRPMLYVALVGGVLVAISVVMGTVGSAMGVSHFVDGPRTVDSARDVTKNSLIVTAGFVGLVGSLALAAGFILVCLNAMRAGLLTRGMGVLGIIVGVLIIFPVGLLATIMQTLWLLALGFLLFKVWPQGAPPAWRTGRAEPWPSRRPPAAPPERRPRAKAPADARRKRKKRRT